MCVCVPGADFKLARLLNPSCLRCPSTCCVTGSNRISPELHPHICPTAQWCLARKAQGGLDVFLIGRSPQQLLGDCSCVFSTPHAGIKLPPGIMSHGNLEVLGDFQHLIKVLRLYSKAFESKEIHGGAWISDWQRMISEVREDLGNTPGG